MIATDVLTYLFKGGFKVHELRMVFDRAMCLANECSHSGALSINALDTYLHQEMIARSFHFL